MELHQQAKLQTAHLPQARGQCLQVWQFILVFRFLFRHRRQNFSTELQICIGLGIIYCLWLPPTSCPETFLSSSSGSPEASPSPSRYILPDIPKDPETWFLNLNLFYGASHMPNLYVYTVYMCRLYCTWLHFASKPLTISDVTFRSCSA